MTLRNDWNEFKKDITPNNIKMFISASIPLGLWFYFFGQWMNFINPLLEKNSHPQTQEEAIISLCMFIAFISPIALAIPVSSFGLWVGQVTRFFKDDKNRRLWWDGKTYFVRDMPQEQRSQIELILNPYKSKLQLRNERKQSESWLRRNFT